MPELPEVETVARSLKKLEGQTVHAIHFRRGGLREPFPVELVAQLPGQLLRRVGRRSKYLLLEFPAGTLIVHLGMSGSVRLARADEAPAKHDHMDIDFGGPGLGQARLRLRDPRRFGVVAWQPTGHSSRHLEGLGPEPLDPGFDGEVLHAALQRRGSPIKVAIMDPRVVVGVGNIYASEALHAAGIDPRKRANSLSRARAVRLAGDIQRILRDAIARGGSTLRDFHGVDGNVGTYAQQHAKVYGRAGEPCETCGTTIKNTILGGRASAWCPTCQKR